MYILGICGDPNEDIHDTSATLIKDGEVIAAIEQERFSRRKHAFGEVPYEAIQDVLNRANITFNDIDAIASSWQYDKLPDKLERGIDTEYSLSAFPRHYFKYKDIPPITFVKHHLAHINSAYFQSGFNKAACLIIDGQGEKESITLAYAQQDHIEILRTYPICFSLGAFYDAAAGYCGLGYSVPGKLMGLAPYGKVNQNMPTTFNKETGEFILNLDNVDGETSFLDVREAYIDYFEKNNYPYSRAPFSKVEDGLLLSYLDFAASVQAKLEEIIIDLLQYLKQKCPVDNLIVSGGVGLNCTANGVMDNKGIFKNIFIYPASNDAGTSLGAALEIARQNNIFSEKLPMRIRNAYIGSEFSNEEIERTIHHNINFNSRYMIEEELVNTVAKYINDNKIVAWFDGRSEFGPRALGGRSILSNPCTREQLIKINRLKGRELWRPLSPMIIEEYYSDVFEDKNPDNMAHFMLKTCKIKEEWWKKVPAILHIDRSSRPQILTKDDNAKLHKIVSLYYEISGIPIIINTSLNIKGEPIVNSPLDAIKLFESTPQIDVLVMGNYVIERSI